MPIDRKVARGKIMCFCRVGIEVHGMLKNQRLQTSRRWGFCHARDMGQQIPHDRSAVFLRHRQDLRWILGFSKSAFSEPQAHVRTSGIDKANLRIVKHSGKIGGEKTAKRGPDYFRKIAAMRKEFKGGRAPKGGE
ncbi:MAG: hypothetical protein ACRD41_16145 [Candidatus Acidiferrales bacterium]